MVTSSGVRLLRASPFALALAAMLAVACDKRDSGSAPPGTNEGTGTMCTAEAKICPDGSSVGRQGPSCEFAPCPEPPAGACTKEAKICPDGSTVGREGPSCEFAPCPSVPAAAEGAAGGG